MSEFSLDDFFGGDDWLEETGEWPKVGPYPNCRCTKAQFTSISDKPVLDLSFETENGRELQQVTFLRKNNGAPNPVSMKIFRDSIESLGFNTDPTKHASMSRWWSDVQDFLLSEDCPPISLEVVQSGKYKNVRIQGVTGGSSDPLSPVSLPNDNNDVDIPF